MIEFFSEPGRFEAHFPTEQGLHEDASAQILLAEPMDCHRYWAPDDRAL